MSDAWDEMKIVIEISDKTHQENEDRLKRLRENTDMLNTQPVSPVTLIPEKFTFPVQTKEEIEKQWELVPDAENK